LSNKLIQKIRNTKNFSRAQKQHPNKTQTWMKKCQTTSLLRISQSNKSHQLLNSNLIWISLSQSRNLSPLIKHQRNLFITKKNYWTKWTNKKTNQTTQPNKLMLSLRLQRSRAWSAKSLPSRTRRETRNAWAKRLKKSRRPTWSIDSLLPKRSLKWSSQKLCLPILNSNQASLWAKRLSSYKRLKKSKQKSIKFKIIWTSQINSLSQKN